MPTASASSWVKFFTNAGVPSQAAAEYAHVFVENRFQMDMLMDLNKDNPPKSAVSRPSLAVSLPSKSQKHYLEHKIKPPDGGESTTNIVRIINECSDNKASLVSTVGSLGRRSAVYERLEHNSNDGEKEDGELKDDIDDAGNGRELPKKMASKVTLKDIEALGKKSDSFGGGGGSIFSRLGEKSNQREQSDEVPAGILKKSGCLTNV
ncbi:hypothetical protein quinque_013924 [Culex quinquefasciatus]